MATTRIAVAQWRRKVSLCLGPSHPVKLRSLRHYTNMLISGLPHQAPPSFRQNLDPLLLPHSQGHPAKTPSTAVTPICLK